MTHEAHSLLASRLRKTASIFKGIYRKFISSREAITLSVLISLLIFFYFTSYDHSFVSEPNVKVMLRIGPELGIIVVGVALLMICGEFDLSVGSMLGLSALIMAQLYAFGLDPFLALFITLCAGVAMGAANGLITVKFGIPSFITTLGTMMVWRGVIYIWSAGFPTIFHPEETSPAFKSFLTGEIGGVPVQFVWFLIFTVIFALLLNHHRFGNRVYATGGNKNAARAMGINTNRTKIVCFILVGFLCAFAGVMQSTRARGAYALQGSGMELTAIAATVVGGTSLFGGTGTVIGAFFGVLIIRFINTGILTSRVPGFWFDMVIGIVLIIVVILNIILEKRRKGLS